MAASDGIEEKRASFSFYPDTWFGCEVQKCDLAAQGLWMNMLCKMWNESPRGVLPGDPLKLAKKMGKGDVARAWADTMAPLLHELEEEGVFSRGADLDPKKFPRVAPDAIVNRRMFRDWAHSDKCSKAGKKGAQVRWHADAISCDLNGHVDSHAIASETVENTEVVAEKARDGDSLGHGHKIAPSRTEPCRTKPKPRGEGEVIRVGDVVEAAGVVDALSGEEIYKRVWRLTRDDRLWQVWWRKSVKAFGRAGKLDRIAHWCDYVESANDPEVSRAKDMGPVKDPGRFLSARVAKEARENGIELPEMPKKAA